MEKDSIFDIIREKTGFNKLKKKTRDIMMVSLLVLAILYLLFLFMKRDTGNIVDSLQSDSMSTLYSFPEELIKQVTQDVCGKSKLAQYAQIAKYAQFAQYAQFAKHAKHIG
jgi:hypothetical protein